MSSPLRLSLVLMLGLCLPANAGVCPPVKDRADDVAALLSQAQAAGNELEASVITNRLWDIWASAPDAVAQEILDRGLAHRRALNLDAARRDFDALVAYCPHYAEGYNQRAFVNFIARDYARALPDLEAAIERDPTHVAAIAGQALTLFGLGRMKAGRAVLRRALVLNPWLSERHMLEGFEEEVDPPVTDL